MFYVPSNTISENKSHEIKEIPISTIKKIIESLTQTSGKIVVEIENVVWTVIQDEGGVWFFKGRGEVFEKVKEIVF